MTSVAKRISGKLFAKPVKAVKAEVIPQPKPAPVPTAKELTKRAKELQKSWKLREALANVDQALLLAPGHQEALQFRGTLLMDLGEIELARKSAAELIRAYPIDPLAIRQHRALGMPFEAPSRERALAASIAAGATATAFKNAASYLYEAELFAECLEFCNLALVAAVRPPLKQPVSKRTIISIEMQKGLAYEGLHQTERAIAVYESILSTGEPYGSPASGLARCLLEIGQPEKAEAILRTAGFKKDGEPPFTPLMLDVLQARGKILESYQLYRRKPVTVALGSLFGRPTVISDLDINDASNLAKTALLLSEGGPGDEFRLSTTYADLANHFSELTITCDPRVESLMVRSFPAITFLPSARYRREIAQKIENRDLISDATLFQTLSDQAIHLGKTKDVVCSVLDTLADIRPSAEAFANAKNSNLVPDPVKRAQWRQQVDPSRLNVGIAWRSMLQSVARNRHYLSAGDLMPLASVPNVHFWLLQPKATDEELAFLKARLSLRIAEGLDLVDDFEGQAAFISNLDAVVSPFATTGELASALGVPTFLVSTTRSTLWRRTESGGDIWHRNTRIKEAKTTQPVAAAMSDIASDLAALRDGKVTALRSWS